MTASRRPSTFLSRFGLAGVVFALVSTIARHAGAQACCAGSGALTPGRLAPHEDALVGLELHAATVLGTYQDNASYLRNLPGSTEYDFEQDLFGALRLFRRAQIALLLPLVETRRTPASLGVPSTAAIGPQVGGGIGDANLSVRYDFVAAGVSRIVPGIAALAGLTAPTGRSANEARNVLGVDATGAGAWQGNFGLALEQSFGPWLLNATELFAWRAPYSADHTEEALAPQWVTLLGVSYVFRNEVAVALSASYTVEGTASIKDAGTSWEPAAASARRVALVGVSGVYPFSDRCRLQGSYFLNPPFSGLGRNQNATTGLTLTLIWSWS